MAGKSHSPCSVRVFVTDRISGNFKMRGRNIMLLIAALASALSFGDGRVKILMADVPLLGKIPNRGFFRLTPRHEF